MEMNTAINIITTVLPPISEILPYQTGKKIFTTTKNNSIGAQNIIAIGIPPSNFLLMVLSLSLTLSQYAKNSISFSESIGKINAIIHNALLFYQYPVGLPLMKTEHLIVQHLYSTKKVSLQEIGSFFLSDNIALPENDKDAQMPDNAIRFEYDIKTP